MCWVTEDTAVGQKAAPPSPYPAPPPWLTVKEGEMDMHWKMNIVTNMRPEVLRGCKKKTK